MHCPIMMFTILPISVESYTIEELKDMVLTQKIQDSKTVAAIMAYYGKYCI
mgnify:CR=1 FL=1